MHSNLYFSTIIVCDRIQTSSILTFSRTTQTDQFIVLTQEEVQPSLGFVSLDEYEKYVREELPRHVHSALENIEVIQPRENDLRERITQMIKDCQEQVFSNYRSQVAKTSIATQETEDCQDQESSNNTLYTASSSTSCITQSIEERVISYLAPPTESPTYNFNWPFSEANFSTSDWNFSFLDNVPSEPPID